MPWYERQENSPFETSSIPGLVFLHGDVVAKQYQQEWVRGKKYPLIAFPSGTTRELVSIQNQEHIHLFGEVTVPRINNYGETLNHLFQVGKQLGLLLVGDGERTLSVMNKATGRGYVLRYADQGRELANLTPLPSEAMELLPDALRAVLPKLNSTEAQGGNAIAPMKFFSPDANWTWYPTEFDGKDTFFGLVSGYEVELGSFQLSELESIRGGLNLPIERDLYYSPQTMNTLQKLHKR